MAGKLIIIGLRRSGTTIFWETFRQDQQLLSYDEPFNPVLRHLMHGLPVKHPEEFQRLIDRDPITFWSRYSPIEPTDELREGLNAQRRDYLSYLFDTAEHVSIDLTRCHHKIEALHELAPDATLVHLYRPPESNATSHLLPSGKWRFQRLRRWFRRRRFWTLDSNYDNWQFEQIMGTTPHSLFGERLREIGLDPEAIYRLPGAGKIMALWRVNFERVERDGTRFFGNRFISQSFDEFCHQPQECIERIYRALELPLPRLDQGRIHPPHGPFRPDSPHWKRLRQRVGLPPR